MKPPIHRRAMVSLVHLAVATGLFCASCAHAASTVTLQQFDAACGQPQHNCRDAFQKAFAALAKSGGSIMLPAGTFLVDFPEVAQNVASGPPLQAQSLLRVPAGVTIQGHLDAKGMPDSVVEWRVTSIPVFIFASASHSGMKNIHFRFIGDLPQLYPYGDSALLKALGYNPTFRGGNQMSGGNYEMSSLIYLFDSEYCSFDNLTIDAATHENAHAYGFGINAKGKGVVANGGEGGLLSTARGNHFTNIRFSDGVMLMLLGSQEDLLVSNITSDWRASSSKIGPGHVIYFVAGNHFDGHGAIISRAPNKNIMVSNLFEGPDTDSNENAIGTLSPKDIDGGIFENIVSHHPAGLIATLNSVENVTFENMTWSSNRNLCAEGKSNFCGVPVIESSGVSGPWQILNNHLTFRKVSLTSTAEPIVLDIIGNDITMDGLTIETPPDFRPNQTNTNSVLGIKDASHVTITNYTYIPLIHSFDPHRNYNVPYTCWGKCSDVHVDMDIKWPSSLPMPAAGKPVITPAIQTRHPGDNNTIKSRVEPH